MAHYFAAEWGGKVATRTSADHVYPYAIFGRIAPDAVRCDGSPATPGAIHFFGFSHTRQAAEKSAQTQRNFRTGGEYKRTMGRSRVVCRQIGGTPFYSEVVVVPTHRAASAAELRALAARLGGEAE